MAGKKVPFFFIIGFDKTVSHVWPLDEVPREVWVRFPSWSNRPVSRFSGNIPLLRKSPVSFKQYEEVFNKVVREINRGNSYLANLTFPTPIGTDIFLEDLFGQSKAKYTVKFRKEFIVFSPETFVRIEGGKISARPMKGTINAALPDAEKSLLEDKKEEAEHFTIVDLMRNDLGMVASEVRVEKFRYVEKVCSSNLDLLQTSSLITGKLPSDYLQNMGDILWKLLPAGSVTGAPKKETVRLLQENEIYDRGYYSGVMGLFDGEVLDSAVMIRYIEQTENGPVFKSGGGITAMSDAQTEYQEMTDKIYVPVY